MIHTFTSNKVVTPIWQGWLRRWCDITYQSV